MQRKTTKIMAKDSFYEIRKAKGLSLEKLADMCQLTVVTVCNYENKKNGARKYNSELIAKALECEVDDIFEFVVVDDKHPRNGQKRSLNAKDVRVIRSEYWNDLKTTSELARDFNVTRSTIRKICQGLSWKEVT